MSESVPESGGSESGNVFTRKLGPLPVWAWMGIALAVALGYYFWQQNQSNSSSSGSSTSTSADVNTPGGVDSSLVPQFVNQTYTNVTPPSSPSVSIPSTITVQQGGTKTSGGMITMPNVVGEDLVDAQGALNQVGLPGSKATGPPFKAGTGTRIVVTQNPKAGSPVAPGTAILLTYQIHSGAHGQTVTKTVNGKSVTTTPKTTTKTTTKKSLWLSEPIPVRRAASLSRRFARSRRLTRHVSFTCTVSPSRTVARYSFAFTGNTAVLLDWLSALPTTERGSLTNGRRYPPWKERQLCR